MSYEMMEQVGRRQRLRVTVLDEFDNPKQLVFEGEWLVQDMEHAAAYDGGLVSVYSVAKTPGGQLAVHHVTPFMTNGRPIATLRVFPSLQAIGAALPPRVYDAVAERLGLSDGYEVEIDIDRYDPEA